MNRFRLLAIGALLTATLAVVAQQTTTKPGDPAPGVDAHLKVLSERLDLTAAQQAKLKPILQEMQGTSQKLMQDETMSRDERMNKVRACRDKADKKAREFLSDEQKKKLDQLEAEPHPELHGDAQPTPAPQN